MAAAAEGLAHPAEVVEHVALRDRIHREEHARPGDEDPLGGVPAVAAVSITGTSARTTDPQASVSPNTARARPRSGSGNDAPGSVTDHGWCAGAHKRDGRRTRIADRQLARSRVVGGIARGNRYRSAAARLRRTVFHRIVAGQHDRIVSEVTRFNPHVLVHLAVWEPHARAAPDTARRLTDDAMISVLGAVAECRALESIILRSGIEVYGRAADRSPDRTRTSPSNPTCEWGRMLADIEQTGAAIADRVGVSVGALRLAPILGPAHPESARPLPAHAGGPVQRPRRSAVRGRAPARRRRRLRGRRPRPAGAAAQHRRLRSGDRAAGDPSRTPPARAVVRARLGGRRGLAYVSGAPLPDHVLEMLHRGRLADNTRGRDVLRFEPVGDHSRGDRPAVPLAEHRPHPGPAAGGVMANPIKTIADVVTSGACRRRHRGRARRARCATGPAATSTTGDATRRRSPVPSPPAGCGGSVAVGGIEHLPRRGGALIVVNARSLALAPAVRWRWRSATLSGAPCASSGGPTSRRSDRSCQRLGGLLPIEDELEGALRAGELVLLGAAHRRRQRPHRRDRPRVDRRRCCRPGTVLPAVTLSAPLARAARVELGAPVTRARTRAWPARRARARRRPAAPDRRAAGRVRRPARRHGARLVARRRRAAGAFG